MAPLLDLNRLTVLAREILQQDESLRLVGHVPGNEEVVAPEDDPCRRPAGRRQGEDAEVRGIIDEPGDPTSHEVEGVKAAPPVGERNRVPFERLAEAAPARSGTS